MFTLLSQIGSNGLVRVTQSTLATLCESTLQQVEQAIADLADAGLIGSVEISTGPGGPFTCVINPDLARVEKPD
jgi:hypothetical protein